MLLSRVLNRGYASGRARWPTEFGLLNHDCLWIMDEVQLMDVGLITSVQLQAFRQQDAGKSLRPCWTWWMSATLQEDWLETADFHDQLVALRRRVLEVRSEHRTGQVWEIRKPVRVECIPAKTANEFTTWARLILDEHNKATPERCGRVTLVIVNTVERASEVHKALVKAVAKAPSAPQIELIHSRFRGLEREQWSQRFLSRKHCEDETANRIVVATQVVEAGVDISATTLVTELAPWPSLVQRFGRAARYGGTASVVVVDREADVKGVLPYDLADMSAARDALAELKDVGLSSLEQFGQNLRASNLELLRRLYRYEYLHLLTRRECDELFDTSPDLTGADLDISRFIRSGDERDLQVCWANVDWSDPDRPPPELQPKRDGLCPVAVGVARKWLLDGNRLKDGCRVWGWDYLSDSWRVLTADRCYPGQVILVDAAWGGYDPMRGFTGEKPKKNAPILDLEAGLDRGHARQPERADLGQPREDRSVAAWKTIATHGREVGEAAASLALAVGIRAEISELFRLVGRFHDWGKVHPAFQYNIRHSDGHPRRDDLAKAPDWVPFNSSSFCCPEANRRIRPPWGKRRGFRHELAGALAVFELLASRDPSHPALLGPHQELVQLGVLAAPSGPPAECRNNQLANEVAALDAADFNLLVYLIAAHHGKVRGSLQGTPDDQDFPSNDAGLVGEGQPLRGIREGDVLPAVTLADELAQPHLIPPVTLHLDPAAIGLSGRYGASWSERVQSLLDRFGPFTLAYLEALFRAADARASQLQAADPLLNLEVRS